MMKSKKAPHGYDQMGLIDIQRVHFKRADLL